MCSRQRGQHGLSPCVRRRHGERRTEEPVGLGCRGQGEWGREGWSGRLGPACRPCGLLSYFKNKEKLRSDWCREVDGINHVRILQRS